MENHGVLERENKILEFGELDDVLWQNVAVFLHDVLILIFVILPKLLEVKDHLDLIHGFIGQDVLVIVTPHIFFEIDFSYRCSI